MEKRLTQLLILMLGAVISMVLFSCSNNEKVQKFDVSQIDTTVNAGDDFYHFAVGNWLKDNPIPEDQIMWAAFTELREKTSENTKSVILEAAKSKSANDGSVLKKVGDFYSIGMDTAKIEKLGAKPLEAEFARIESIKDLNGFHKEIAHMHMNSAAPLFYIYAGQDDKNSTMMIAKFWQGGIGLPDRDYYVENTKHAKEIRAKYLEHLQNMFVLLGEDEKSSETSARTVMEIETRLAKASNTRTENRDPDATYNKLNLDGLKDLAKNFDWDTYLAEMDLENPGDLNIAQPKFMEEISKMVKDVSLNKWKSYLRWNLIRSTANYLSSDFVNERFKFTGKFLNGQKVIRPRWKRVVDATNGSLGEAVGQLYVKEYFPPEAKKRAKDIVDNLLVSMGERIKQLDWMSEETKDKALEKLDGFGVKIGYPDKWRDYSKLEIKDDSYVQNILRSNYFDFKYNMSKVGKPVDKTEWWMTPQTVNAGYSPSMNDITFPAGILQFPFFDKDVDDAINYGAMGAVIGHEITHGFDDQGRKYDVDGNLNDWWTDEDSKKFEARTKGLVMQFDEYEPFDSFYVNGKMTLGENIADLGGLTVALQAFKKTEQYKKNKNIDGYTPTQRFFLSWANVWKNNIRDEALKQRLKTDVHSPGMYRVIGPLSNMDEFIKAFEIKEGQKMAKTPTERVNIW